MYMEQMVKTTSQEKGSCIKAGKECMATRISEYWGKSLLMRFWG